MKRFSCGDVVPNCVAHFAGETEDDILVQVGDHARRDHGMANISFELVSSVRAAIVTV